MAAGFEESYIRIWSLKGESLNGMKSDFNSNNIKDSTSKRAPFLKPPNQSLTPTYPDSLLPPKNSRKRRLLHPQTNRPLCTRLLPRF